MTKQSNINIPSLNPGTDPEPTAKPRTNLAPVVKIGTNPTLAAKAWNRPGTNNQA